MACSLACRLPVLACLSFIFITSQVNTCIKDGHQVPCAPGQETCSQPFQDAPSFHLMSQRGCAENDPNGPVFDPVHGVIHHFYQDHLAAGDGQGPIYGHFVSKDFVHWTELPVAIWNGLDASSEPPRRTLYDTMAIFTGSALVLDGAGPQGAPGVLQIYPGICDAKTWPGCKTGVVLAQALPADYGDQLLTNWTKPLYNPIVENVQRDPSTPWKETSGEWRLRTFDGEFYGAASDADLLGGKWYRIGAGDPQMWPTCECPSFFPLPGPTPGFETDFYRAKVLPSHVQKISCEGKDWWMLGTYTLPNRSVGSFVPTKGWEDLYVRHKIDAGAFYASKDALYPGPADSGKQRRINWGWARVKPASAQSLPRVITFNPRARRLEQAPLPELEQLRGQQLLAKNVKVPASEPYAFRLPFLSARRSETLIRFNLPQNDSILSVGFRPSSHFAWMPSVRLSGRQLSSVGLPDSDPELCQQSCDEDLLCTAWSYEGRRCHHYDQVHGSSAAIGLNSQRGTVSGVKLGHLEKSDPTDPGISCTVHYQALQPSTVACGSVKDSFHLLEDERTLDVRIFADATMMEVFFQGGRSAMTLAAAPSVSAELVITSTVETSADVSAYAMKSIWVNEEYIRKQARVYPSQATDIWS